MFKIILFSILFSPLFSIAQDSTDDTGSELSPEQVESIVAHHNKARAEVNVAPLKWSNGLAEYAQEWANTLAATEKCDFKHRQNGKYGENIFMSSGSLAFDPVKASEAWYSEKAKYNYSKISNDNSNAWHYTQMIWKNTTEVGVGMATCKNGNIIVVANYNPAGNYSGQFPY